ncbi:uncharacterized protein SCHCODRAFT_02635770 [Schizophyllum commune H4-8]|nr:uncharacterized protein SCHCODRAFT_02635770 [Schizophyllum commune H4-8]KAI5888117.1 hypothetical protein SCHCODRAFT_02635770 [Schizophyllum commune H4-8]
MAPFPPPPIHTAVCSSLATDELKLLPLPLLFPLSLPSCPLPPLLSSLTPPVHAHPFNSPSRPSFVPPLTSSPPPIPLTSHPPPLHHSLSPSPPSRRDCGAFRVYDALRLP